MLTGLSEVLVRITAISAANPTKTSSVEIAVYVPVKKAKLNVTKGTLSLTDNAHGLDLDVLVTPKLGTKATGVNLGTLPGVKYEVAKKYENMLSVDSTGLVKVRSGAKATKNIPVYATLTAFNGYTRKLTCKVTIKDKNALKTFKLSKSSVTVGEGNQTKIGVTLNPANADGDLNITWTGNDYAEVVRRKES